MINIILFEPEIANNTGNIIRTCHAFNAQLHLIRPYGFFLDNKSIKRASTNHFDLENINQYDSFDDFIFKNNPDKIHMFSRYGKKMLDEYNYQDVNKNIYFMFGKESKGIDKEILKKYLDSSIRIPMNENSISMNLSNIVAIAIYEVVKQRKYDSLIKYENFKD